MNKPAIKQKPKPPPYPRPVPHFVVEELPPRPEDIAWSALNGGGYYSEEDDNGHDEVEAERRAAKRRRIEAHARSYLRGDTLLIQSARLKGPFDRGWKNPWVKRRSQLQTGREEKGKRLEIPETAKKTDSNVGNHKTEPLLPPQSTPVHAHGERKPQLGHTIGVPDAAPSPFTSKVRHLVGESSPRVPKQVKEQRVETWLRTNDTFAKTSEVLVHSSPTPPSRRRRTPGHSQEHAPRASQSEPPRAPSPKVHSARTVVSLRATNPHASSDVTTRVQKLSKNIQDIIAEPTVQLSNGLHDEVRKLTNPASSPNTVHDSFRAEHAIMKARRNDLQKIPADAHMSPFEFRTASGAVIEPKAPGAKLEARPTGVDSGIDKPSTTDAGEPQDAVFGTAAKTPDVGATNMDEDVFATAPQLTESESAIQEPRTTQGITLSSKVQAQEQQPATDASRPLLSTAVSEISITDMLPSAQPRLEPQPSVSSVTRDEKLLSIKPVTSVSEVSEENGGKDSVGSQARDQGKAGAPGTPVVVATNGYDKDIDASTPVALCNAADINTQELLAQIEPIDLSTVKKPKTSARKDTPMTATKVKSDTKRKRTSFAVETSFPSSHGSIKDVMKAKVSKSLGSPLSFLLGKGDPDVEVSDDENVPRKRKSRRPSSAGKPKGILKSTNPSSSPSSVRKLKSVYSMGQEQEGQCANVLQVEDGQNGIEEDNFDLDAAIDDLGSFLGTWDAEKEASSLNIEL